MMHEVICTNDGKANSNEVVYMKKKRMKPIIGKVRFGDDTSHTQSIVCDTEIEEEERHEPSLRRSSRVIKRTEYMKDCVYITEKEYERLFIAMNEEPWDFKSWNWKVQGEETGKDDETFQVDFGRCDDSKITRVMSGNSFITRVMSGSEAIVNLKDSKTKDEQITRVMSGSENIGKIGDSDTEDEYGNTSYTQFVVCDTVNGKRKDDVEIEEPGNKGIKRIENSPEIENNKLIPRAMREDVVNAMRMKVMMWVHKFWETIKPSSSKEEKNESGLFTFDMISKSSRRSKHRLKRSYDSDSESNGKWFMDVFHVKDQLRNKLTYQSFILYIQHAICYIRSGGITKAKEAPVGWAQTEQRLHELMYTEGDYETCFDCDWYELEREATNADREHGGVESDSEEERKLKEVKSHLQDLRNENAVRLQKLNFYISVAHELSEIMSFDFSKALSNVHRSLVEFSTTHVKSISNDTLARSKELVESLNKEKRERVLKLQGLGRTLQDLWNLIETPMDERRRFEHCSSLLLTSGDGALRKGCFGLDIVRKAEDEVKRLNDINSSKIKELVFKRQCELEEICREFHMDLDSDAARQSFVEKLTRRYALFKHESQEKENEMIIERMNLNERLKILKQEQERFLDAQVSLNERERHILRRIKKLVELEKGSESAKTALEEERRVVE